MRTEVPDASPKSLVIGYGNTLRSDDGAGVRVADVVAAWHLPGVTAQSYQQLTPEIAASLNGADIVVFVDAQLAEVGGAIMISRILPGTSVQPAGHISDPRSILALSELLFERCPEAWLIAVPAVDLSMGDALSATAERGVEAACELVRGLVAVAASTSSSLETKWDDSDVNAPAPTTPPSRIGRR